MSRHGMILKDCCTNDSKKQSPDLWSASKKSLHEANENVNIDCRGRYLDKLRHKKNKTIWKRKNMKTQATWIGISRSALALAVGLTAALGTKANAELVYGVSDQLGELVSFDSATPGTLLSAHALTGMASGEQIRGIDEIGGTLYGLGDQNHLYTIDPNSGSV